MTKRSLFFLLGWNLLLASQVWGQRPPTGILGNPTEFGQPDSSTAGKPAEPIIPWSYQKQPGFTQIADDSLLRWQIWPNWGEKFAYRHDVISFRQGNNGRIDAYNIAGYGPYEQRLYVDGINMNHPVTGLINYNFVPSNKVGYESERFGAWYTSNIRLKEYYLTEALSYLNYDEAKYDYRNLEFMVARNFSERTQAEISFWDRRDGGNYYQNEVVGSQIFFKGYHYITQNLQIRTTLIRSAYTRDEPFGYQISSYQNFKFDKYTTSPISSSSSSEVLRRDFIIGVYARADSMAPDQSGISFSQTQNEFELPASGDTLQWDIRSYTLSAYYWLGGKHWRFRPELTSTWHIAKQARNFSRSGWGVYQLKGEGSFDLTNWLQFQLQVQAQARTTNHQEVDVTAGFEISHKERTHFQVSASVFNTMPTIQQLYWTTGAWVGNESLQNSRGISFFGKAEQALGPFFNVGVSSRYLITHYQVFLGTDSTFVNYDHEYPVLSGALYVRFKNHRFEVESSVAGQALTAQTPATELELWNKHDRKIWLRNNFFVRGYVFDRAAYVRGGIRTTLSPFSYRSAFFNTAMQFWEPATLDGSEIPAYFRMDAELSARVRAIMVLLRWENTLEGFGQLGYFETSAFPMPGRRLIVGIRAQFRN